MVHTRWQRTAIIVLALAAGSLATIAGTPAARADQVAPAPVVLSTPPDLRIDSSSIKTISGNTYIVFVVKNGGGLAAGPFNVEIKAGNGALVQAVASGGLGPGKTLTVFHKLPGCVPYGLLSRTIVADSGNAVAELSEANNSLTKLFSYGPSCS